ncbi:hypothetical protein CJJ07_003607 [Candidozyma auris]|nr:hypothetical protein CJJ07_003607 [[Candida] auris]QEL62559.1 hypothetical protein CJJ09_004738 [[Candida] auris]
MTTSEPDESFGSSDDGYSRKRTFEVDSGQSAEQYMSQLLAQKRRKINDDEDTGDEYEDEDESYHRNKAGYIKKIILKNFMCHDHFELDFGPQMNFIIGRNGSGKSAIITGISVGLGAKATDTNRGSSIKSLIKDGKNTARIIVEIDNDGFDSFERSVYGSKIIVERKLLREGSNNYYIKNESGAIVSTKKKTLDEILQKFFIVVNNPLSFLSQDKAREFIASSTESSRFTHFSEGTNIQSILSNYQDASRNIMALQQRSKSARKYFEEACQKYKECERTYQKYRHSHNLREQSERINGKMYWYNVGVMERRLRKKQEDIDRKFETIQSLHTSRNALETSLSTQEEKLTHLNKEHGAIRERLELRSVELQQAEENASAATRHTQQLRNDLTNYKTEVDDFTKQIEEYSKQIEVEQKKIDEINGGSKDQMKERLTMLKAREQTLTSQRDELHKALTELEDETPELLELNRKLNVVKSQKLSLQDKIRSIQRTKNDKFAAFGPSIQNLLRAIENEVSWHKKPIGPVGCFVSVKKSYSRWSDLINAFLQKTLDSFIVCDEHDRRLLTELMRSRRIFKSIIVRKFESFAYNTTKVPNSVSVLDALEIHVNDVLYTLIDSSNIEETVICDAISSAEQLTRIAEVRSAFCLNDKKSGIRIARGRNGAILRDPVFYSNDLPKLAGKSSSDDNFRRELEELLKEESSIQLKRNNAREALSKRKIELQRSYNEKRQHLKDIQNQIFSTERLVQEEGDYGRIQSLEAQIDKLRNQIKTREGMFVEVAENGKEAKRNEKAKKAIVETARNSRKEIEDQLLSIKMQLASVKEEIDNIKADIEANRVKCEELQSEIKACEDKKAQDESKLADLLEQAQSRCTREVANILPEDTTESITTEYMNIQQAIEESEKSNRKSFEEISDELLEARANKAKCENNLTELENARITLENDLNSRFENLNITIKEKLTRAKSSFEHCLALRGFKGRLEFDFANKKVLTEVQTKDDKETRTVSSLSGGEKSFTQIAFLLSIWKVMKPRVCGLDEFDVFMDSVNRTIAIRLLIHELRSSNAQSIFITPQDITAVGDLRESEDVKIHQIKPPRQE